MANGDLYLSDSPNVDKGFVEQQDGTLQRAVLQATPSGDLQLSDSANVDSGYVTDTDGKKHKVHLVAEVDGSLELPNNPASDQGYVVDNDGKKHRVQLVASLYGSGGSATIDELNVTPSTSAQTITATGGVDGYSPVNVSAVTSSIDANIVAGNIKKDVTILGVTGSFEGGVTPTGTLPITSNGVYDVTNYASADVQVPTTAPEIYRVFRVSDGKIVNSITTPFISLPNTAKDIDAYCYYNAYANTPANILSGAVNLSSLELLSGAYACYSMFSGCSGITSVDLSSLASVSGSYACQYMFYNCTGITSVDVSSLTTISDSGCNYMFSGCSGITSVDLSSLTAAASTNCCNSMFYNCTNLASVDISHLCKVGTSSCLAYMFRGTALTSLSFPNLAYTATNINSSFSNTLQGVTGCTVHFPSDWQTAMASYSNITNGLGGTNTTVLFDLPAVTTLDLTHIISANAYQQFYQFAQNNYFANVTKIDLSSLKTVSAQEACYSMFKGSTGITSVDLSSLTYIGGKSACYEMFSGCSGITSIDVSSLTTVVYTSNDNTCRQMFAYCTSLTNAVFSSLSNVDAYGMSELFRGCTSMTSVSFPALKTADRNSVWNLVSGVTGCTVHFPSNLSSINFNVSGTNTTVLYDLPATNTLTGADSKTYSRNPKYDTATALAWKEGDYGTTNFTPAYYTSTTADPAVNDTIYSDAACTTAVTTISTIA
jgi:hypothetical protein